MAGTVRVKGYEIGEGKPGIIVPIVAETLEEAVSAANRLKAVDGIDMVEWRMDFYEDIFQPQKLGRALETLRAAIGALPLLCTFRTRAEGGEKAVDLDGYTTINKAVAESGQADLIDVEMFSFGEEGATRSLEAVHRAGVPVVGSNHHFDRTPPREEMVRRLGRMRELGADILKIAVMPHCTGDVLTLLAATNEARERYPDRPLITMAMSGQGVISRLAGEVFGSAMTFGAVGKSSAPGQVPVEKLVVVRDILHEALK